jgi:hypothetical protein
MRTGFRVKGTGYRQFPVGDVIDEERCGAYTKAVKDIYATNPRTGKTNP